MVELGGHQTVGFAAHIQKREFTGGKGLIPEDLLLFFAEAVLLGGIEVLLFRVPPIQGGALHTDEDRHDADDRPEDFIEIVETDHRLRHLQQRRGCIRLFLRRIVEARIFDGDCCITGEGRRHGLRFVAISAGRIVSQGDDAIGLVTDAQGNSQPRVILFVSGHEAGDPYRVR